MKLDLLNINIPRQMYRWLIPFAFFLIAIVTGIIAFYTPTFIWIGLFAFLTGLVLFWNKPEFGLIVIIVTFPVYFYAFVNIAGLNIRVYNAISLCLLIVLFFRKRLRLSLAIPSAIYLVSISASVFTSMDPLLSVKYVIFQLFGIILMWVTSSLVRTEFDFEKYLNLFLWVGNIDAVLIILNTLAFILHLPTFAPIVFTHVLPIGRPNLFLGEPDRTAEYHLVMLLVCLALILLTRNWKGRLRLSYRTIWISFFLNMYIVVIGLFRSAWIGVLVAILAFLLIAILKRPARTSLPRLVIIGSLASVGVLLIPVIYPPFFTAIMARFSEAFDLVFHPQLDVQTDISVIYVFFQRAIQRPWLGWGIGYDEIAITPAEVFTYHLPAVSEGYNRFIRMFFGAGIVGLAGFVMWQFAYFRRLLKGRGEFAYRMACLLPVIGVYWGHDMLRMVNILPSLFFVMGLGLSLEKIGRLDNST